MVKEVLEDQSWPMLICCVRTQNKHQPKSRPAWKIGVSGEPSQMSARCRRSEWSEWIICVLKTDFISAFSYFQSSNFVNCTCFFNYTNMIFHLKKLNSFSLYCYERRCWNSITNHSTTVLVFDINSDGSTKIIIFNILLLCCKIYSTEYIWCSWSYSYASSI